MLSHRLADAICGDQSDVILAESGIPLYNLRLVSVTYFYLILDLLAVIQVIDT